MSNQEYKVNEAPASDIETSFRIFHEANPHVYQAIVSYTMGQYDTGCKRLSMISEVFGAVRSGVITNGDRYRLNNSWAPFYVRLMQEDHPDLAKLFEVRQARWQLAPHVTPTARHRLMRRPADSAEQAAQAA